MELQPFGDEQLNFLKFASLVLDEFPKALRQAFKTMWDNKYGHRPDFQVWDDSTIVRKMFYTEEEKSGKKTEVPVHQSYNEWDCTSLFQATIFARCFASKGSTLKALYAKRVAHGSFHASVISSGGNNEETFALSIDQLRLLRNSLCHSTRCKMDKATFDQRLNYAKDAFHALGVSTALIDAVGNLTEADFPTSKARQLETRVKEETGKYIKFLEEVSSDLIEIKALLSAIKQTVGSAANKEDIARLEKKIAKLQESQDEVDAKVTATDVEEPSEKKKKIEMTEEVKDGAVADDDLVGLSLKLGRSWDALAERLGFSQAEIDGFDEANRQLEKKSLRMLRRWKEKNGPSGATYKVLYEDLCHSFVARKDLAVQFCNA